MRPRGGDMLFQAAGPMSFASARSSMHGVPPTPQVWALGARKNTKLRMGAEQRQHILLHCAHLAGNIQKQLRNAPDAALRC
jgi:hypothetical protein